MFTQPDTLIQNVYDPQSLNRYMFERGNPYKNTDETGHYIEPYSGPIQGIASFFKGGALYVGYTSLIKQAESSSLVNYFVSQRSSVVSGYINKGLAMLFTGTSGQGEIEIVPGLVSEAPVYYEEPPTWEEYRKDKELLEKEKRDIKSMKTASPSNQQTQFILPSPFRYEQTSSKNKPHLVFEGSLKDYAASSGKALEKEGWKSSGENTWCFGTACK